MIAATTAYTILNDGYMPLPSLSLPAYRELVGKEVGRSDWIRIDQAMIDAFAALTGDDQFIHIDPERAAKTPFGTTIAHGYLTLALIAPSTFEVLVEPAGIAQALNYGLDRVRFLTPVKADDTIAVTLTVKQITPRTTADYGEVRWDAVVTNEAGEPVATYDVLTLVAKEWVG